MNKARYLRLGSNLLKKVRNIETWSLSAYEGGRISKLTTNWIHLPTHNMEIAEDLQMIIFHYFKQKLLSELKEPSLKNIKYKQRINESTIT